MPGQSQRFFLPVTLLTIAIALVTAPAAAQTGTVDRAVAAIGAQYDEMAQRIRLSQTPEGYGVGIFRSELVVNKDGQPWRAVGIYRLAYNFWFEEIADPDRGFPKRLRQATIATDVSSRHYAEAFFYDKAGALIFHLYRRDDGDRPAEFRLYFDKNRPVRAVADGSARDRLTPDDGLAARRAVAKSDELKRLFALSLKEPD